MTTSDQRFSVGPQIESLARPPSAPPRPKLFIICGRCGRMANRMVLFANFIALAEEQGHRVMNPTFHSYANFFVTTRRDIYCQYPVAARRSWLDLTPGLPQAIRSTRLFFRIARPASLLNERFGIFGRSVVTLRQSAHEGITVLDGPEVQAHIAAASTVLVNGWNFRAPSLVKRHAEKIKGYFRPIACFEQASRMAVERLRQKATVVIGVHVRRGDYSNWRGGECFFELPQYARWMSDLASQFAGTTVSFLVCSNETRDSREFPGLTVGLGAGSPVGDLYALAQCDYIFGPPSTFSQWASFYGGKPLVHLSSIKDRPVRERFAVSDLREVP